MENLIIDLKEKLVRRKESELKRIQKSGNGKDEPLILISTGRVFELDHMIRYLEKMLLYYNETKKIVQ